MESAVNCFDASAAITSCADTEQNSHFLFMLILSQTRASCCNDKAAQTSCGIVCNFTITVSRGVSTTPITAPKRTAADLPSKSQMRAWLGEGLQSERERERDWESARNKVSRRRNDGYYEEMWLFDVWKADWKESTSEHKLKQSYFYPPPLSGEKTRELF